MEIYAWEPASLFVREREKRKHMLVDGFVSVASGGGVVDVIGNKAEKVATSKFVSNIG